MAAISDKKAIIEGLARDNNATLIKGFTALLAPIDYKCNICSTEVSGMYRALITRVWCNKCGGKKPSKLEMILKETGYTVTKNYSLPNSVFTFEYLINTDEDAAVIIILPSGQIGSIRDEKVLVAQENGFRVVQIDSSMVEDEEKLTKFIAECVISPEDFRYMSQNNDPTVNKTSDDTPPKGSPKEAVKVSEVMNIPLPPLPPLPPPPLSSLAKIVDEETSNKMLTLRSNMDLTGAIYFTEKSFMLPEKPCPPGMYGGLAYIRVSSNRQLEGVSIDQQTSEIQKFCRERNIHIRSYFYDLGVSAKDSDLQPALIELRKFIKPREKLVAYHRDRVSREPGDIYVLEKSLKKIACELLTVDFAKYDIKTPEGFGMRGIQDTLAGVEKLTTSIRVSSKLSHLSVTGELQTKCAYGFQRNPSGKGAHVPCPREQAMIEYIRRYQSEHPEATITMIVNHLNHEPDPVLRKGKMWYHSTLKKVMDDNAIPYPKYDPEKYERALQIREEKEKMLKARLGNQQFTLRTQKV
jgi:DNA invertase Pin-like site-specific DNA recombinase/DNA-directed RNA polymerase subunit RPC12/RpoP